MGDVSHERETLRRSDITQDHQARGSAGSLLSNTKTLPEDPEGPDPTMGCSPSPCSSLPLLRHRSLPQNKASLRQITSTATDGQTQQEHLPLRAGATYKLNTATLSSTGPPFQSPAGLAGLKVHDIKSSLPHLLLTAFQVLSTMWGQLRNTFPPLYGVLLSSTIPYTEAIDVSSLPTWDNEGHYNVQSAQTSSRVRQRCAKHPHSTPTLSVSRNLNF